MIGLSHSWARSYNEAIEETNREKLPERVLAAAIAI
jgi:hypothetical protein